MCEKLSPVALSRWKPMLPTQWDHASLEVLHPIYSEESLLLGASSWHRCTSRVSIVTGRTCRGRDPRDGRRFGISSSLCPSVLSDPRDVPSVVVLHSGLSFRFV